MRTCIKLQLFNSAVLSVLLCGSETWVLTEKLEKILNSFHTTCLRIILGVSREDHITNNMVYQLSGTSPLSLYIQERQLRFLGHSLRRSPDDPINPYALYDPSHGKRSRGRKTDLYAPYVKNDPRKIHWYSTIRGRDTRSSQRPERMERPRDDRMLLPASMKPEAHPTTESNR